MHAWCIRVARLGGLASTLQPQLRCSMTPTLAVLVQCSSAASSNGGGSGHGGTVASEGRGQRCAERGYIGGCVR